MLNVTMVSPRVPRSQARKVGAPVFPGYTVVRELAAGGMGVVYEGYQRSTGQRVAIKTMRTPTRRRDLERRFRGEAIASQRIQHRSITRVLDFGFDQSNYPFLVMEYLDGECLTERVERNDLSVDEFCQIAAQLVDVVAAAHRAGILHRDIKPANIVLLDDPERPGEILVKLIDFGVAKFVSSSEGFVNAKTAAGVLIGTPAYMSPEQCLGDTIDARSDIYAIGCLLYELLTGRCPFVGSISEVLIAHRTRCPVPVSVHNPAVPPRLASLVDRMLRKRPTERPASMRDIARELRLLEHDRRGPPPPPCPSTYAAIPRRISHPKARRRAGLRIRHALFALAVGAGAAAAMLANF